MSRVCRDAARVVFVGTVALGGVTLTTTDDARGALFPRAHAPGAVARGDQGEQRCVNHVCCVVFRGWVTTTRRRSRRARDDDDEDPSADPRGRVSRDRSRMNARRASVARARGCDGRDVYMRVGVVRGSRASRRVAARRGARSWATTTMGRRSREIRVWGIWGSGRAGRSRDADDDDDDDDDDVCVCVCIYTSR